jgi:hypothetical protein
VTRLRDAYELIRNEDDWCRWVMNDVNPKTGGTQYCASGAVAVSSCSIEENAALVKSALALFPDVPHEKGAFAPVVAVNDLLGHEAVIQVFEKALVEREGSL